MSFYGTHSDAKAIVHEVEVSENTHSNTGSPILNGRTSPGGAADHAKPSGETMSQHRTKLRTRTDTLQRSYASTAANKRTGKVSD